MTEYPAPLKRVIEELSRLPGIGERTAGRLAFYLLKEQKDNALALAESIRRLKQELGLCPACYGWSEIENGAGEVPACKICRDMSRERAIVCVVEEPSDMMAVERSGEYRGIYHVLHGAIFPLNGVGPESLKVGELVKRIRENTMQEIILATNATRAGDTTALYIANLLKPLGVRVTRIARGLPLGGELEYTDAGTLGEAFEGRREL